jgi:hypothetical protein
MLLRESPTQLPAPSPPRARIAAAVEESTPPDMATAIVLFSFIKAVSSL